MPVTLKQTISRKNGEVLQPSDLTVKSNARFECDSPRCAARHGETTVREWSEDDALKSPDALPDAFFRLIKIMPNPINQDEAKGFCSVQCCKDWLTYAYVPPKTGKQIMKDTVESAAQLELPFPPPLQETGDPWAAPDYIGGGK